jgi:hypothetical protein
MTPLRALLLVGGLLGCGSLYLGWALSSESGYEAGGRAIKAQLGFLTMPHAERQSLRKLALMKAAGRCEWDIDEDQRLGTNRDDRFNCNGGADFAGKRSESRAKRRL